MTKDKIINKSDNNSKVIDISIEGIINMFNKNIKNNNITKNDIIDLTKNDVIDLTKNDVIDLTKKNKIINKSQKKSNNKSEIKIKKKSIPLTLKRNVWNKHIGESIGKTLCLCCKLTEITQLNFSCGHIISEFNGGELKLNNLKPICVSCNSSIGTKNMNEYMDEYGL